jgi:hypothetical protein
MHHSMSEAPPHSLRGTPKRGAALPPERSMFSVRAFRGLVVSLDGAAPLTGGLAVPGATGDGVA